MSEEQEPTRQEMEESLNTLIGKPEGEAITELQESGWRTRVIFRDGVSFMRTMDYRMDRANLSIVDGIVKSVSIG